MAPPKIDPFERFYNKITYRTDPDGCDVWTAGRTPAGYGVFAPERTQPIMAHRWVYAVEVGPIPAGMVIDHLCRNPACVNPNHLEAVSPQLNTLRGLGPTSHNAEKTHCPRGHEYDIQVPGGRWCRTCKNEAWHRWNQRRKARVEGGADAR